MTTTRLRTRACALAGLGLTLWMAGCEPARSAARPTVSLRLHGGPPQATVVIDEEALGSLEFIEAHGVALPPGVHHLTVQAEGYFPLDREVEAEPAGAPIVLDVSLIPVPD